MRWFVAVTLFLAPWAIAWARECSCGYPVNCTAPCEQCRPQQVCVEVAVPRHPGQPERAPEQERGAFAAPPRTGMIAGESESVGLSGGALHIPSISFRLPTIQLPCFTRYRREAHMVMDTTEAPFVLERRREYSIEAGPEIAGVLERAPAAPERAPEAAKQPEKQPCAPSAPPCDAELMRMRQREQMLEQRIWQLEQCLRQMPPPPNTQLRVLPPASPPPAKRAPVQVPQQAPARCQDGSCPPASANPGQNPGQRPGPVQYGKPPMEEIPMPLQDSSMAPPAGQPTPLPRSPFQADMAQNQSLHTGAEDPRIAQLTATVARLEQRLHAFQQSQSSPVQQSAYYHPIVDLPVAEAVSEQIERLPQVE